MSLNTVYQGRRGFKLFREILGLCDRYTNFSAAPKKYDIFCWLSFLWLKAK